VETTGTAQELYDEMLALSKPDQSRVGTVELGARR